MKYARWLIGLLILVFNCSADTVIRCKDVKGKWRFTDDKQLCAEAAVTSELQVNIENVHSEYGAVTARDYYSYAFRNHSELPGYSIPITVESELLSTRPELVRQAALRLEQNHKAAIAVFPAWQRSQFSGIRYFIYAGDEYRDQKLVQGLWYMSTYNPGFERWGNSIVVRSAQQYVNFRDEFTRTVAVHELSHALYYYHWQMLKQPSAEAFDNAKHKRLYVDFANRNGEQVKKAYALNNQREYFAELSVMYLMDSNDYPFNKKTLATYDPLGYQLVRTAWERVY